MRIIDIHSASISHYGQDREYLGSTIFLTGNTNHYSSGGFTDEERICIGSQDQICKLDSNLLYCVNDYIGGGSHYWHLWCGKCGTHYVYDTYRFQLEVWPENHDNLY